MKTIVELVYSPIKDKDIKKNLNNSIIWKKAFKQEELTKEIKAKYPKWYEYKIKFKGVTPIQVTNIKEIK